jgi:hypothetical protein
VCTGCTNCSIEEYESEACSNSTDRVCTACTPCTSGNYASVPCSKYGDRTCSACANCTGNFYEVSPCTEDFNRVCSKVAQTPLQKKLTYCEKIIAKGKSRSKLAAKRQSHCNKLLCNYLPRFRASLRCYFREVKING